MPSILSHLTLALSFGAAVYATPIEHRQLDKIDVAFSGPGVMYTGYDETSYCISEKFQIGDYFSNSCPWFTATPIANTLTYTLSTSAGPCGPLADGSLSCGAGVAAFPFVGTQQFGDDREVQVPGVTVFTSYAGTGQKIFTTQQPGTDAITLLWVPQ